MRIVLILVGLLATASPPDKSQQFDLICTADGSQTRYRVDLTTNEACSDTCDRIWKMGVLTAGELKLIDRAPAYRGDLEERATVNRATGEYRYSMSLGGRPDSETGHCERTEFSGFPTANF